MQNEEAEGKIESLGKYVVLEEIGRGGMARVFRAEDTETGELVAIPPRPISSSTTYLPRDRS